MISKLEHGDIPEFGAREPGHRYDPRPGSYGLISDDKGRIAVLQTPQGCFLPGGGSEGGETPDETLVREVREECGFAVSILGRVGEAVEYRRTAGHKHSIRKECVFFTAALGEPCGTATEEDHALIWLEPREAERRLAHGSQQWAVHQSSLHSESSDALAENRTPRTEKQV